MAVRHTHAIVKWCIKGHPISTYPGCQRIFMCSFRFRSSVKCDPREKDNLRYTILLLHAADGTKLPVACEEKPLREKKPVREKM